MRPLKSTFYFKASEKVQKDNKKATRAAANEAAYAQQQQQQQPKKCTKTKLNQQAAPAYPHPPSGILVKAVRRPTHTPIHTHTRSHREQPQAGAASACQRLRQLQTGTVPCSSSNQLGPLVPHQQPRCHRHHHHQQHHHRPLRRRRRCRLSCLHYRFINC